MKIVNHCLVVAVALLSAAAVKAQTVEQIVAKYVDAVGGKEKISGIKSMRIEGTMSIMGNEAPTVTIIVNGKGYRNEVEFNGQKIVQAVNEKGGWMIHPMMGGTDAQAMPEEQFKSSRDEIYVGGPLVDYATKGNKIELQGKEKVGAVEAYKLKVTSKDNATSTYYVDPTTYYLIKVVRTMNMGGQEATLETSYSNFKKTDYGYVLPHSVETTLPQGFSLTANINKVEFNKDVDPKIFDMPK